MNHSPGEEEMEYILKQIWRSNCEKQTLRGRQKGRQGLAAEVVSVKEKRAGGISV